MFNKYSTFFSLTRSDECYGRRASPVPRDDAAGHHGRDNPRPAGALSVSVAQVALLAVAPAEHLAGGGQGEAVAVAAH